MDVDGMMTYIFQSTRSARSATGHSALCVGVPDISIHALRKERDHILHTGQFLRTHFNPRAPQGARLADYSVVGNMSAISIHALRKERDSCICELSDLQLISIHALRKERDSKSGHKRPLLRCIHNDYSPHMCFFLMFTSTNLIQLDF